MTANCEDQDFLRLARKISEGAGLAADAYKPRCLRRRIAVRMRATNAGTYEEYLRILEREPGEYQRLADALTINVTRFFRNPELWQRLESGVLPDLWQRPWTTLRVWSAGCASGEEPYSFVMLAEQTARAAGHPEWLDRLVVDATDVDRICLERARKAWYPEEAFSETPPEVLAAHTLERDGGRELAPAVRRRVRISRLDLTRETPPHGDYAMIICRNVLIYFDRPMQERLFDLFVRSLCPGGYLVLGKVETVLGPMKERLELVDTRERIYRRSR